MADRIQQRRDTAARWAQYNPILLEGEVGYVTDDPNQYKIGDGVHAWNELPLRGFDGTLVHELGTSNNTVISQKVVSEYIRMLIKDGDEVSYEKKEGYFWDINTNSSKENAAWIHTSQIPVTKGQLILVKGYGGIAGRLVTYYRDNGTRLFASEGSYDCKECCLYVTENGYIICNSTIAYGLTIKIMKGDAILHQITDRLNVAYSNANKYAMCTWNGVNAVKYSTIEQTLTIPATVNFTPQGFGNVITTTEEITIKNPNDGWGSHFIAFDYNLNYRFIASRNRLDLNSNEFLFCLIRWDQGIWEANLWQYYLDGILVDFKNREKNVSELNKNDWDDGWFIVNSYSVGDVVTNVATDNNSDLGYKRVKVNLKAGDEFKLTGTGGSLDSRLYMTVRNDTNEVTEISEAGVSETKIFAYDYDCTIYITVSVKHSYSASLFKNIFSLRTEIDKIKNESNIFREYAQLLNKYPIINTKADLSTLTIPTGTLIINNITPTNRFFTTTEDIVWTQYENKYNSYFCVLDVVTLEPRMLSNDKRVILGENEVVVAYVKFNQGLYGGNCPYYYYNDELRAWKEKKDVGYFAPKMFNPVLDLQKSQLKVLDIGNSYTEDSTHYLPELVKASGIDVSDMCLYRTMRGGASFKSWYDCYHDQDNAAYSIHKVVGGITANISGTAAANNGEQFRNTLINNDWDLIIIHQVSQYAPYYDKWEENSNAGYLSKLIRLIRKHQPKATLGFLLVHSYWSGYSANTEQSSLRRWKLIAESAMKLRANYGIDFIIPYGTAIQNLRASSLNNDYDLTGDGTHCANGLADYTAACTYFQSLFAPRYGVSVLGNTARIAVSQTETYPSSDINVTDENAPIAQIAAITACYNWYECINPEDIEDENLI